jgi:hypothetical protein
LYWKFLYRRLRWCTYDHEFRGCTYPSWVMCTLFHEDGRVSKRNRRVFKIHPK